MRDMVLVLNFDDASSRCVTRKLRSERVYCKIVPGDIRLEEVREEEPLGLVLCGSALGEAPDGLDERVLHMGRPLLALGGAAAALLGSLGGGAGSELLREAVAPLSYAPGPVTENVENAENTGDADNQEDAENPAEGESAAPERHVRVSLSWEKSGDEPAFGDRAILSAQLEGYDSAAYTLQWQYLNDKNEWVD